LACTSCFEKELAAAPFVLDVVDWQWKVVLLDLEKELLEMILVLELLVHLGEELRLVLAEAGY
jgi:hypothetical protein